MLRLFEAFSGIGAQREALDRTGKEYEVVATSEWDVNAIAAYGAMYGIDNDIAKKVFDMDINEVVDEVMKITPSLDGKDPAKRSDIEDIEPKRLRLILCSILTHNNFGSIVSIDPTTIPDHDLFTYSFPCQDISIAGRQEGFDEDSDTRSSLLWECKKIIEVKRPKYLLLENVKNLVSKTHIENFNKWLDILEGYGYTTTWKIINAYDIGVPQNRERVFAVSTLDGEYEFSDEIKDPVDLLALMEDGVSDDYNITDKLYNMLQPENVELPEDLSDKQVVVKNATKKGYLVANIGDGIDFSYPNSSTRRGRVQKGRSHTITTFSGLLGLLDTDCRVRKFTPLETWRLMSFSDEAYSRAAKVSNEQQLYKLAGNSIVVKVLEHIFDKL